MYVCFQVVIAASRDAVVQESVAAVVLSRRTSKQWRWLRIKGLEPLSR